MSFMYIMRNAAWLACSVVLSQVIFLLVALWVMTSQPGGILMPFVILVSLSVVVGAGLCWKCSRRSVFFMGAAIALYMPATHAFFWVVALAQDLIRGDNLPGPSLQAVGEYPLSLTLLLPYLIIAILAMGGGLIAQSRRLRRKQA